MAVLDSRTIVTAADWARYRTTVRLSGARDAAARAALLSCRA
jgi:hypothetical protein